MRAPILAALALMTISHAGYPSAAEGIVVELYAQPPFSVDTQTMNLDTIEEINPQQLYRNNFELKYRRKNVKDALGLEEILKFEILTQHFVDDYRGWPCEKEVFGIDYCPDIALKYLILPILKFVKGYENQPSLSLVVNNQVAVRLYTRVQIDLRIIGYLRSPGLFGDEFDFKVPVVLDVTGEAPFTLWPTAKAESVFVQVSETPGTLDSLAEKVGEELDAILPLGDEIAEIAYFFAKDTLVKEFDELLVKASDDAENAIDDALSKLLSASSINEEIAKILDAKVPPPVNLSLNDLVKKKVIELEFQARTVGDDELRMVLTPIFLNNPAGSSFPAKVRFPRTKCDYVVGSNSTLGTFSLPIGISDANENLAQKVGQDCSGLSLPVGEVDLYVGEDPADALCNLEDSECKLLYGLAGDSWEQGPTPTMVGKLKKYETYYACDLSVKDIPRIAIAELSLDSGAKRVLALDSVLLSSDLEPLYSPPVFGMAGPTDVEDCPGSLSAGRGVRRKFDFGDFLDPGKCPKCGIRKIGDRYVMDNPAALTSTDYGQGLKRLVAGRNPVEVFR